MHTYYNIEMLFDTWVSKYIPTRHYRTQKLICTFIYEKITYKGYM